MDFDYWQLGLLIVQGPGPFCILRSVDLAWQNLREGELRFVETDLMTHKLCLCRHLTSSSQVEGFDTNVAGTVSHQNRSSYVTVTLVSIKEDTFAGVACYQFLSCKNFFKLLDCASFTVTCPLSHRDRSPWTNRRADEVEGLHPISVARLSHNPRPLASRHLENADGY